MKTMFVTAMIAFWLCFSGEDQLTGKWESPRSAKGNVTGVVFKRDQSFEGYVNKKPFTTGQYTLHDSIFSFTDNGCEGRRAVYKVVLFSNADSLRFVPVSDSCNERREGMSMLVMGRVK